VSLKVFIDTNVFLDSYLNRDKGVSKSIFNFLETRDIEIYLNDISIINIAYIIRKHFSKEEIKEKINLMLETYNIVSANQQIISLANNSTFTDFEDGVQYYCAKEINADLIISNNKKDFKSSKIDVLTPIEFSLLYINL
jgi:predicted nucleic acid-binding protein